MSKLVIKADAPAPITESAATSYAKLFLDQLQFDPDLRRSWTGALAGAQKLAPPARPAAVNKFLQDHGYETTADDLQQALSQPPDPSEAPNADAIQLAARLITDGDIRQRWDKAINAMVESKSASPDPQPVVDFLAENKVNASPLQVARALRQASLDGITQWVGSYGDTVIAKGNDKYAGPTLIVTGDFISLDKDRLVSPAYDQANATLNWTQDMNQTAGAINFSLRNAPSDDDPYVGSVFNGKLTLPDHSDYQLKGEVDFSGRLGPPKTQPPNTDIENLKNAVIVFAVLTGSATLLTFAWRFRKFISRRWNDIKDLYRKRGKYTFDEDKPISLELKDVDKLLGLRKMRDIAKLKSEFENLKPSEKAGATGKDYLKQIDEIAKSLSDEQREAIEEDQKKNGEELEDTLEL